MEQASWKIAFWSFVIAAAGFASVEWWGISIFDAATSLYHQTYHSVGISYMFQWVGVIFLCSVALILRTVGVFAAIIGCFGFAFGIFGVAEDLMGHIKERKKQC